MPALASAPVCVWDAQATLGEGTCWSPRLGALWWVDILQKRLLQYRPGDAARRSWQFDTEVTTVVECREAGPLLLTLRRGIARFEPGIDAPPRYVHEPDAEPPNNRFNDGKCDRQGRLWTGTMDFDCKAPTGALYRYAPDGSCVRHALNFAVTNGPTWSLDQRTLFVNETVQGRVHAFDFEPLTGGLSRQREWLRFAPGDGVPDGMTTDAAGRLWIAHWGGGCVSCHDPVSGAELGRIAMPASQITNCCFGGPDLRTLFVTSAREGLGPERLRQEPLAGGLFSVELEEPGVAPALFGAP